MLNIDTPELMKALKEGLGLRKKHKYNHSDDIIGHEFVFYDVEHKCFDQKGWGSARDIKYVIEELIKYPELWEIAGRIDERQWISENESYETLNPEYEEV